MKTRLLVLALAMCMIATPAKADLFNFTVHTLDMTYAGGNFDASLSPTLGGMFFTRAVAPISTIVFGPGTSGDFDISMAITVINSSPGSESATGVGDFILTDVDGDTITGDVSGEWGMTGVPTFAGELTNVNWTQVGSDSDDLFHGDSASVSMVFTAPQPWYGTLIELTATGAAWFGFGDWTNPATVTGGSVDAAVIPVPAAVILGVLGLGVVGWKLRKYA